MKHKKLEIWSVEQVFFKIPLESLKLAHFSTILGGIAQYETISENNIQKALKNMRLVSQTLM